MSVGYSGARPGPTPVTTAPSLPAAGSRSTSFAHFSGRPTGAWRSCAQSDAQQSKIGVSPSVSDIYIGAYMDRRRLSRWFVIRDCKPPDHVLLCSLRFRADPWNRKHGKEKETWLQGARGGGIVLLTVPAGVCPPASGKQVFQVYSCYKSPCSRAQGMLIRAGSRGVYSVTRSIPQRSVNYAARNNDYTNVLPWSLGNGHWPSSSLFLLHCVLGSTSLSHHFSFPFMIPLPKRT